MSRLRTLPLLRVLLGVVGAAAAVFVILSYVWFVAPAEQEPEPADAIYVLGGGGERVEYALDLLRDGVSLNVVFSSAYVPSQSVWSARPCNTIPEPNVPDETVFECFEANPHTTRGEAQLLRDLAEERGWEKVVVVASTDQVTRARRLIERCWDGEVLITSVPHNQLLPVRVAYEWGAGMKATFLRGC